MVYMIEPFNKRNAAIDANTKAAVMYDVTTTCATFVGMAGLNMATSGLI